MAEINKTYFNEKEKHTVMFIIMGHQNIHRSRYYAVIGSNIWCGKLLIELSRQRNIKPDYLFQILHSRCILHNLRIQGKMADRTGI